MSKEYKSKMDIISLKKEKSDIPRAKIGSSVDGAKYARMFYHDDISMYESMFLMLLNNANNTVGYVKISQGGVTGTIVDIKLVAKYAVEALCSTVIMVHNHPSGNLKPSEADKSLTIKVKTALQYFDIKLLDHLIIVDKEDTYNVEKESVTYYSFADSGIL